MKRLTIELLLLLLLLVSVFSAFEWSYRDKQSSYDIVFKHLKKEQDSLSQITIGNSHVGALLQFGLSDSAHVFNLGLGGQDLFHMLMVLKKCMPDCPQLKTVLLGLDYDLLGYNFNTEKQAWKDRQYFPYTGKLYDSSLVNCLSAKSAFLRLNRDFRYLFVPDSGAAQTSPARNNFIPPGTIVNSATAIRQRAIEHSVSKYNAVLVLENMQYVEQIIMLCKERNVKLVIINTPKQSGYVKSYSEQVAATGRTRIESLLMKHHLAYLDYFHDTHFSSDDFMDADHLNSTGSKKLIQLIKKDIGQL